MAKTATQTTISPKVFSHGRPVTYNDLTYVQQHLNWSLTQSFNIFSFSGRSIDGWGDGGRSKRVTGLYPPNGTGSYVQLLNMQVYIPEIYYTGGAILYYGTSIGGAEGLQIQASLTEGAYTETHATGTLADGDTSETVTTPGSLSFSWTSHYGWFTFALSTKATQAGTCEITELQLIVYKTTSDILDPQP